MSFAAQGDAARDYAARGHAARSDAARSDAAQKNATQGFASQGSDVQVHIASGNNLRGDAARDNGAKTLLSLLFCLLLVVTVAMVVTGCVEKPGPAQDDIVYVEGTPAPTVQAMEEKHYLYAYPFTGLGTDLEMQDRPIMVMVENQKKARPQTGLGQADLVYEVLAEGEITRFLAVYQSESPAVIGPVRSIRPYFVEIGDGLDALIVHAGWSQDAMNILASRNLNHFDEVYGDGAYYWRDNSRKAPHNLYTSVEKIRIGAENKHFREEWNPLGFKFANKDAVIEGSPAPAVRMDYLKGYYVTYDYDAETKQYKRGMEGEPHEDKETGAQLTATNVLICESAHNILDNAGRRDVDVFGPGKGYLIQQGVVREVTWERQDNMIRPFINGEEVGLLPGKTWIQIVPEGSNITFQ